MNRATARENAFKTIYSQLFNADIEPNSTEESNNDEFSSQLISSFSQNREEINALIASKLKGYTLERLFKVDLAIITLAVIELNYIKENPKEVIINEAVKLAKKYSTEKSPKFINGLLADIVK